MIAAFGPLAWETMRHWSEQRVRQALGPALQLREARERYWRLDDLTLAEGIQTGMEGGRSGPPDPDSPTPGPYVRTKDALREVIWPGTADLIEAMQEQEQAEMTGAEIAQLLACGHGGWGGLDDADSGRDESPGESEGAPGGDHGGDGSTPRDRDEDVGLRE